MAYHHGDLRRALLTAAADAIAENGVAALSMRDLARRAGVSHAAPTHHFRDRAGLLTAFATDGFEQLARAFGLAAWSMAHGFATLWLTGAFPDRDVDPAQAARLAFQELNRVPLPPVSSSTS